MLYLSDSVDTITVDFSSGGQVNYWTPDTECLLPAIPGGTATTTLNVLLTNIIEVIENNVKELAYKSDLDHKHTTEDITNMLDWFNGHK